MGWRPKGWHRQLQTTLLDTGTLLTVAIAVAAIGSLAWSLLSQGHLRLDGAVFSQLPPPPLQPGGGFRNALVGTLTMVTLATLLSGPVGIGAAIYRVEFAQGNVLGHWVRLANGVLSGVPSILCGLFAYGVVVLTTGSFSAVAGGVALAVVMVPLIERTSEDALQAVSNELRWGAMALGASRSQTVLTVVLPTAAPAVATGLVLAIARATGETAPLLFTALFSQYGLQGLWQPTASLSVLIYNFALSPYPNHQAIAWTAALGVVSLVGGISLVARRLLGQLRQWS